MFERNKPSLHDRVRILIDLSRKRLAKKLTENKLGDMSYSYSEEEKKELVENTTLAQQSFLRERTKR